jgi:hypothetical protein
VALDTAGWQRSSEGEQEVARRQVTSPVPPRLVLDFAIPGSAFSNGGPLVGLGSTADLETFGMRFGYEVGIPEGPWIEGLDLDTDFDEHWVLTPRIEVASPFYFFPSLGLGLGAPIMLSPDTTVGVRVQGVVSLAAVSYVTSFDWFPGLETTQWSMFGVFSL